ncbi:capsular polysaccharide biosynthesis protein [Gilliamella sp. Pra-s65]|uniref:capsular polysaccharide biosynthesis protein n=1 Tax=unclassified Gilliamella TaxID=2685620 RepID=UPI001366587A|nr:MULTISPECIES: capsular polysaccharide biosynthesis protein [unclassified Gilliamella]MWN91218.1 capsular polysaccharide biosynthesis protein [Gilliamella sp. Pra-s65]MWP74174.1 capsular polysaccharide biosynthesis protein [Gilliamella sp. Pra-s52]
MKNVLVFSKKILTINSINHFFPNLLFCKKNINRKFDAVAGWGYRPTTIKARAYATKHLLPFIALEDGFLRSIGLGLEGYPPLSLIADNIGIYYDSRTPSELEILIKDKINLNQYINKSSYALKLIIGEQLSKYNHAPNFCGFKEKIKNKRILVIDQTFGDMAVELGGASQQTFISMLNCAIEENPSSTIYVKTHTDVINGYKKGYLTKIANRKSVILFDQDVNSFSLLKHFDKVYVVTSHMGFEALLLGKQVITFGLPWYAGWGVTDDRHKDIQCLQASNRRTQATILELFTASYILYCKYINPYTGKRGTIFDVINYLIKIKSLNNKLRGTINLVGFSFWKKYVLLPYLRLPSVTCRFHSVSNFIKIINDERQEKKIRTEKLLIWGQGKKKLHPIINQLNPLRIEDGFIRSIGLGSNLVMPYSLVIDEVGIYFNSQNMSELEFLLASKEVNKQQIERASLLQNLLIVTKLGKYNIGEKVNIRPRGNKQKIILIPGQVEDDASILYGSPIIKTNLELIKSVRRNNPDDYIIYKPHPDVLSGNRKGKVNRSEIKKYIDDIIEFVDIIDCIEQVDEIHTITSLAGFEALIRNKQVVCYGQPFYSGWGLTIDMYPNIRRNRALTLQELIYIVMYDYAIYIHPDSLHFTDPETLINYLNDKKLKNSRTFRQSWLKKQFNKLKQVIFLIWKIKLLSYK